MHAILFSMKRAHHAALAMTRPMLRRVDLTPARFDMLFALFDEGLSRWGRRAGLSRAIGQARLRTILGVCRMTVSRMIRALEALGLVRRWPVRRGGRRLMVQLTERGDEKVRRVVRDLLDPGPVDLAIDSLVAPASWFDDDEVLARKERLHDFVLTFLRQAGDTARLPYTWHPDD